MTDAAAIFNVEAEHTIEVVDGITGVTANSKFSIDDYALALRNGGAAAAFAGVPLDEFNTVIALSAEELGSGQRAGTSFRNFLLRLVPATDPATDAMRELGLITEDGSNAFFDAEGNLRSMSEVAEILQVALGDLSEEQRQQYLRTIFGNDAMGAAIALANEGSAGFDSMAESIAGVDANELAAQRLANLNGALEILKSVVETVRIQVGDKFLPVLEDLARRTASFIDENAESFIAFFEDAAAFVETFINSLLDGQGPMDSFFDALAAAGVPQETIDAIQSFVDKVTDVINTIVSFVQEHSDAFMGAITAIGAVLAGAGIVAAVTAIAGAIATLVSPITLVIAAAAALGAAWASDWGGIRTKTLAAIDKIRPKIEKFVKDIRKWWDENGEAIISRVQEIWANIQTAFEEAVQFIRDLFQADDPLEVIRERFGPIGEFFADLLGDFFTTSEETLGKIGAFFEEQFGKIATFFEEKGPLIEEALQNLGIGLGIFGAAAAAVLIKAGTLFQGFWEVVAPLLSGLVDLVLGVIEIVANVLVGDWDAAWNAVLSTLLGVVESIHQAIQGFLDVIASLFGTSLEEIRTTWTFIWESIPLVVDFVVLKVKELVKSLVTSVKERVEALKTSVLTKFNELKEKAVTKVNEVRDNVLERFEAIKTGVQDRIDTVKNTLSTAWDTIKTAATTKWNEIKTSLTETVENIKSAFTDIDWGAVGQAIIDGIANAIANGAGAIAEAAEQAAAAALEAAKNFLGIESPSKKAAAEIGKPFSEGMAVGAEKEAAALTSRFGKVGQMMMDAITPKIAAPSTGFSPLSVPATPQQIYNQYSRQTNIDRSVRVDYTNASGGQPIDDRDQLLLIMAGFA
jgi:TP901 family phage tail tape measure protein